MQKEVTVSSLIQGRLSVPPSRILLADDSGELLGLNFILMNKLEGPRLRELESTLTLAQLISAYTPMGQLLHHIPMEASAISERMAYGGHIRATPLTCRSNSTRNSRNSKTAAVRPTRSLSE